MNDTKTVSGAIVHVTDADEAPLVRCLVDITPKQSGTGTPSPDNVRAISGWESVSVTDAGKNLLPNLGTAKTENGITFTPQADGSVLVNGTATATATYRMVTNTDAFTLPEGTYIISGEKNSNQSIGWSIGGTTQYTTTGSGAQFALDAQSTFDFVFIRIASGQTLNSVVFCPMIRLASDTDPTYEPYTGTTTTVNLGRTVYGGTLDVVSGVLTVTHGYMKYTNISTTSGVAVTDGWRCNFLCPDGDINKGKRSVQSAPTLSMFDSSKPLNEGGISKGYSANNYTVIVPNATSKETADASLEGLELVYPLATPQTYTLTGQNVTPMYGENYIWGNSGSIEITYRTKLLGIYNKIYINGSPYFQPNDFEVKREDVYAGEYTSCTGKLIADKIGWKYSDLTLKWDILPDEDLGYLTTLTGIFSIAFRDSDGQHTEQVIRRGFANTPTRVTGPSGTKIWTDVEMEISFLNTHTAGE